MPYTKDRKQLPDYVAALDDKDLRNQWVDIFNSSYAAAKQDGKDDTEAEAIAFRNANGVLKKRGVKLGAEEAPVFGWFSKLNKAQRDALSADDFGDPQRRLFPIVDQSDVDGAAHLIGKAKNPEAVKARIIAIAKRKGLSIPDAWKTDAKMTAEFAMETGGRRVDGEYAVYPNALLFEAGEYPTHDYAMSPEEMWAAVETFAPVTGNIAHTDFLKGRACEVRSIRLDDTDSAVLRGEVAVPLWLDEHLEGRERRLSCEWDRATKQLTGLALLTDPQVETAALMSALIQRPEALDAAMLREVLEAAFASPRHDTHQGQMALQRVHDMAASAGAVCKQGNAQMASSHEAKAMQGIHDIAADHGAVCSAMPKDSKGRMWPADQPLAAYGAQEKKMGFWEEMKAKFGEPPADPQTQAPVTPPAPAATPSDETAAQLAATQAALFAERAELARVRMQVIQDRAAAFADKAIADLLAYPAEREHLIACHVQAALDDHQLGTVQFNNQKTTRVALFEQEIAARPEHGLTKEEVGGLSATGMQVLLNQQKTATPQTGSPERIQKLKEMTPVGRDALKNGHSN